MTFNANTFHSPMRYASPGSTRWSISAKLALLTDISTGKLSVAVACAIYDVSVSELDGWADALSRHGRAGLKATFPRTAAQQARAEKKRLVTA